MNKKKPDWIAVKNEYLTTNISTRDLAAKNEIPYETLKSRSIREKWNQEKQNVHSKITAESQQKTIELAINEKTAASERHYKLYGTCFDVIELLAKRYKHDLENDVKKTNANAYNAQLLMNGINLGQKGQRLSLGMDKEATETEEPIIHVIKGLDISKI